MKIEDFKLGHVYAAPGWGMVGVCVRSDDSESVTLVGPTLVRYVYSNTAALVHPATYEEATSVNWPNWLRPIMPPRERPLVVIRYRRDPIEPGSAVMASMPVELEVAGEKFCLRPYLCSAGLEQELLAERMNQNLIRLEWGFRVETEEVFG